MKLRHLWHGLGIYTAIVIISVVVLVFWAARQTKQQDLANGGITAFLGQRPAARPGADIELVPTYAPSLGPKDAAVTIVEFGDFQCPYCRAAVYPIRQVLNAYPKDVRLVFRHFPITSVHELAQELAEASLCAHDQGKFWPLHDQLYANQESLSKEKLDELARSVGLDMNRFENCLLAGQFRDEVNQDFAAAASLGARGTPTWIVNGQKLEGALPFETWQDIIDSLLKR